MLDGLDVFVQAAVLTQMTSAYVFCVSHAGNFCRFRKFGWANILGNTPFHIEDLILEFTEKQMLQWFGKKLATISPVGQY